jgi:hypothetical protein
VTLAKRSMTLLAKKAMPKVNAAINARSFRIDCVTGLAPVQRGKPGRDAVIGGDPRFEFARMSYEG